LLYVRYFTKLRGIKMIDRWRIVLTDENGIDSDLSADLPEHIAQEIDEIIEADNDVTWEV